MINVFDPDNYRDGEPLEVTAGSFWAWKKTEADAAYPSALYTLFYRFNLLTADGSFEEIQVGKVDGKHLVQVAADVTGTFTAGEYAWQLIVRRESDETFAAVLDGNITVLPKFDAQAGDTRTETYKALMAVRALIANKATSDQMSYQIKGRSISRIPVPELIELEVHLTKRWNQESELVNRRKGKKIRKNPVVSFKA